MPTLHSFLSAVKRALTLAFALLTTQASALRAAPSVMPLSQEREKMQYAGELFQDSKWTQAIPIYSTVLSTHPNNVRARENRGLCYCRLRQWDKAIRDFDVAIELNPKSTRAYQHRGYIYYQLGKYEKTIQDSTKAIALAPNNRYAYRDRSKAYAKVGKLDLAQRDFAVHQRLHGVARDYSMALELEHRGQFTKALSIFENSATKTPGMFNANYQRACIYSKLGMYQEAIDVCDKYIKEHPTTFEGRRLRAINYLQIGELDKAIADADVALKANPEVVDPYYVKARAATYKKNYSDAIKNYSEIIKLQPAKELPARMERADVYAEQGEYDKAIADYDFLAKTEPKDETIFHHRSGVYLKMKNYDKAVADLQKFVQLAPKDSLALMSLGDGLFQAHRNQEAVQAYSKAIQLDATSPTLFESRAKAYELCNKNELAKKDRDRAHELRESN
ncbi:MAG: tetratricopeptide repeat protein [Candidatus Melainabacteria bacterium]|nr:tetratricopeptide repeat protein [Candidatus Melainabacteria bacterium]